MTTSIKTKSIEGEKSKFPLHGWLGLSLVIIFWILNWTLAGPRTHWGFFPLWLGYCLAMDGLVFRRTGTSLLKRSQRKYVGLFLVSAPVWWIFELLNVRTQNWNYIGAEIFTPLEYAFWTTLSFTTVIPAVFGSAEFFASFDFVKRLPRGPIVGADKRSTTVPRAFCGSLVDKRTTLTFFILGWIMLAVMLIWPRIFFPFIWLSLYFILEPINIWLGYRSFVHWTQRGDWRPILSVWLGVLLTAFFWEMWNYYSYPKWIYHVAWGGWLHIFEMPLLGYGGYLPFALELYALYHWVSGLLGNETTDYVKVMPD